MSSHSDLELDSRHVNSALNYPDRTRTWLKPRRRTAITAALISLILFSLFFLRGVASSDSKDPSQRWDFVDPQPFIGSSTIDITSTKTATPTQTNTVYQSVTPRLDPVVFFLIIWSESSAVEAAILIKVREMPCMLSPVLIIVRHTVDFNIQHQTY